ncbi:hypothetical protein HPP92_009692 [Vanilla planifolia]|uniref:BTB domain-containing protein n=1 Tax=Vanilla planifolia TaxID=51239 RepID=A0A835V6U8_VANPL|nr:hypothetical protein HPP92_009692 [Vanilla planifolia]
MNERGEAGAPSASQRKANGLRFYGAGIGCSSCSYCTLGIFELMEYHMLMLIEMRIPASYDGFRQNEQPTDVQIVTSDGQRISAHAAVLKASASPVLERMLYCWRKQGTSVRVVHILGAPFEAVLDFVRFLYAAANGIQRPPFSDEMMARHGVQLLALAHAYRVDCLKRLCEAAVGYLVDPDSAIDVMKLARLCDAPRLKRRCLAVVAEDFVAVQRSEGWRFVQRHDPRLEMEVLLYLQEREQRMKRWKKGKAEREVFMQLSEAMACLEHICTEGCTEVGPHDGKPPSRNKGPCNSFRICETLQLLIRHFATCAKNKVVIGGCIHCRRMWQLFRLHSSICDQDYESCKVPLCRQFKQRTTREGKEEDVTWRLLVRKVMTAKVMSSLASRRTPDRLLQKAWERCRGKN